MTLRTLRAPRTVIYGGRAGDRWIGSPADLDLAERERVAAANLRRQTATLVALGRMGKDLQAIIDSHREAFARFAVSYRDAAQAIASAQRRGITEDEARARMGLPALERTRGRRGR